MLKVAKRLERTKTTYILHVIIIDSLHQKSFFKVTNLNRNWSRLLSLPNSSTTFRQSPAFGRLRSSVFSGINGYCKGCSLHAFRRRIVLNDLSVVHGRTCRKWQLNNNYCFLNSRVKLSFVITVLLLHLLLLFHYNDISFYFLISTAIYEYHFLMLISNEIYYNWVIGSYSIRNMESQKLKRRLGPI